MRRGKLFSILGAAVAVMVIGSGIALATAGDESAAGIAVVPAGSRSVIVDPGIDLGSTSKAFAELRQWAGKGVTVERVKVKAQDNQLQILLSAPAAKKTKVSWGVLNGDSLVGPEGPIGPEGPTGPEGPRGAQGEPALPADIYTFNVQVPVGETATLVAAAGFELTAECNETSIVVKLLHTTEAWKRASLNSYPAGVAQVIQSQTIVNGFSEGHMPGINGWSTGGDVFSNAVGVVAWLPATQRCLFAAAPHVQAAP